MTIAFVNAQATRLWTGGASGDWDNAMNWQGFALPQDGDIAEFQNTATITAAIPVTIIPAQIKASAGATLMLDLDITVGNGVYLLDALYGVNGGTVQVGTGAVGRTVTVNVPGTQKAFRTTGSTSNLVVSSGSTLSIQNAGNGFNGGNLTNDGVIDILSVTSRGINNSGAATVFTNNGTLNISNPGQSNAIELANNASFNNNGTVNILAYNLFGIFVRNNGLFNNNSGGVVNIQGAVNNNSNGIDLNVGAFVNDGTMNISSAKKMGIRVRAGANTFTNNGSIVITDAAGTMDRGIESLAMFTNAAGASITIAPMQFAGAYINNASTFQNDGTLDVKTSNTANSNFTAGLVVFNGTFNNTSNNSLIADGGANAANRRAINVDAAGILNNSGTITSSGGFINQNIRNLGTITNEDGGTMQLNDGRVASNAGSTFVNNGLMISTHTSGVGVQVNGVASVTNNGFFDFAGNNFGTGTYTPSGLNVNVPIDANNTTMIDLAERPYTWYEGANLIGTASSTGELILSGLSADAVSITTDAYDIGLISIDVMNINDSALPIELISFNAEKKGRNVVISWETASEINSAYMAVEKASSNSDFREISRIENTNNEFTFNSYNIVDDSPIQGYNYYRLKQVDLDGKFTYSDKVVVEFNSSDNTNTIKVFPTVSDNYINIEFDEKTSSVATLVFINQRGLVLKTISLSEQIYAKVAINDLPNGMYYVVVNDRNTIMTEKIIKL